MMTNLDKINNVLLLAKKVVSNTSPTDPDVDSASQETTVMVFPVMKLMKSIEDLLECLVCADPTDPNVGKLLKSIEDLLECLVCEDPTDPDVDILMNSTLRINWNVLHWKLQQISS